MGRGSHSTDSKRYFDWLYYAYEDKMAAELLGKNKALYSSAAFHCQQCMEKALKAYLLFNNRRLFDGHNLTWLCKQAALTDSAFAPWINKSTLFNRYYIETRYPADMLLEVTSSELDDIFVSASELMELVCARVGFDFNSYHKKKRR